MMNLNSKTEDSIAESGMKWLMADYSVLQDHFYSHDLNYPNNMTLV